MGRPKGGRNRKWTVEEKLRMINRHLENHESLQQVAIAEGVSSGLLSTWISKYLEGGEEALVNRSGNPYAALVTAKSLSEEERLRLIVAKQEVEIARLKKGYFVKGVGAGKEYVIGKEKTTKSSRR
ncbi:MAG: transposase [Clostridiales bacterium]|jgi:transposase-like protein|nr:transposase [Clostridiales bacterium]